MVVMKAGLAPIKSDPMFLSFFTKFDPSSVGGLLLCVLVGAGLTILVQSSSATIGLTMTLASQGLLTFPGAMALVLGENIGTTITAELATIGSTNINAHRAARAHTMFNVIGVTIMLLIFPLFIKAVEGVTLSMGAGPVTATVSGESINISRYIANGHTLFNVVNASIFLFFLPWLIKVAVWLSPKEKVSEEMYRLPNFGNRLMDTPIAALAETRGEIARMAETAKVTFHETIARIGDRDSKKLRKWRRIENYLDDMQREITAYLSKIYQSDISEAEAKEISSLMRMTNNLERIGDSVENIAQAVEGIIDNKLEFSDHAKTDLQKISGQVKNFIDLISTGIQTSAQDIMEKAEEIENTIDSMREQMRQGHVDRIRSGNAVLTRDGSL